MKLQKEVLGYFQEMKQFFIKKGKKTKLENAFRSYLWTRAISKKTNFLMNITKIMLNTTPYIRLRAKKRRKYTKYKLEIVQKDWARKKALGAFAKGFKEHSINSRDFYSAIDKELDFVQSGKSNIETERNDYHKKALKAAPYRWRKIIKKKEKEEKKEQQKKEWEAKKEQRKKEWEAKKEQQRKEWEARKASYKEQKIKAVLDKQSEFKSNLEKKQLLKPIKDKQQNLKK